ncbi:protein POLLEN DEFECTIVE IN GUIDANCE 1 [Corylus avellana]|uniref:protein POLLEN DEFECTIVE IN GUIDANCE 1 n=1 Tax=Corylus avellana TaxID=13451 RepID=UPI002869F007|nr:protein POLLEN DEFECTIVE IN GUIDANCE 1 [Corylus avellana]
MALRSDGRKLSFEILSQSSSLVEDEALLYRSDSDPVQSHVAESKTTEKPKCKKRRHRKGSKRKKTIESAITEDTIAERMVDPDSVFNHSESTNTFAGSSDAFSILGNGERDFTNCRNELESKCMSYTVVCEETRVAEESGGSVCTVTEVTEPEVQKVRGEGFNFGELRQRSVSGTGDDAAASRVEDNESEKGVEVSSAAKQRGEPNGSVVANTLETAESLDWKRLMAEDPNLGFSVETSPFKYFMEEMHNGNSLRSTTTLGNEKERERVYDTIFRLPWRCELLIDVGFFVCLDSFLSMLTVMPTRIVMTLWRLLCTRQFKMRSAAELSDFGCFLIMACGVTLLQRTDISLIYHMIRGQGTIKLYVVYNVLEIFDKLCQNFNGDVLQTLFNSAEGLASCPPESMTFWLWRFIFDLALAMAASIVHSFILLAQAITLSTVIVAHNNALLALLVSNNFSEIKSNVFKRFSKDNIHSLVYFDSVERFHISAFMLFVLAQNILEAEGPWLESFIFNALMVYVCEMAIDIIKHSFIGKFNDIKPIAYSEFLEDLCKQTLNIQTEGAKKNLTFVPLAPACVVIRVLTPVYAAHLPYNPFPWRVFWIILLSAMTFVMLTSLKVMIGMGLKKHANWYVKRCRKRNHHLHYD